MPATGYIILWLVLAAVALLLVRYGRPTLWWWYSALYCLLSFSLILMADRQLSLPGQHQRPIYEALAYSLCTGAAVFGGLRHPFFGRHPYLMIPGGIMLFLLGGVAAVNILLLVGYGL